MNINSFGLADYPPGTSLGPRRLSDYEFIWIERGECEWRTDGATVVCPPGAILLCRPGMNDVFLWDRQGTTRHGYVHFEFHDPIEEFLPLFRRSQGADVIRPLLRQAVWLAGQDTPWTDQLAERAVQQAVEWYVSGFFMHGPQAPTGQQHPVLTRAIEVLRERWREGALERLSVAGWASAARVSRGHLARVCQQELSVTPGQLLRYLRLEHGLFLLTRSELKIQAVSALCGFANPFHFSRICKQAYGLSPSDIRERSRCGEGRPASPAPGLRRIYQYQLLPGSADQLV